MNYQLAKQLEDNRFPKGKDENGEDKDFTWVKYPGDSDFIPVDMLLFSKYWQIEKAEFGECSICPSLLELVEACGDYFGELNHYRNNGYWECQTKDWTDNSGVGRMSSAETPEEAVAKLWFELNKWKKISSEENSSTVGN